MAVEEFRSGGDELATVERWPNTFDELQTRVARRFLRPEVRGRVRRYLGALLGRVKRKNGWQMAEQMGEVGPQGAQRLLNAARWDADAVRDDLREYVIEHLGEEESGVLIVDETGFLKKGEKSVGVARQYTGTAGRIENAQVGVFVAYASEKGAAFVDRALYLPREEWANDPLRREEAGVPEEVRFATKGELAKGMLRRAFEAKVPARWVVADTVYGTARGLRGWLEEQGHSYVLAVPATKGIYHKARQRQARSLAKDLPEEERDFRLGWSLWRRAHQAVAKRCHTARRALHHKKKTPPPRPSHPATGAAVNAVPAPMNARLTDEGWTLLEPLLPSQKPPLGRPRRDHRTMLAGMLWVLGSGASWRDLPEEEFGPWQTVYARYRKWCREGLWQRIMEVLDS